MSSISRHIRAVAGVYGRALSCAPKKGCRHSLTSSFFTAMNFRHPIFYRKEFCLPQYMHHGKCTRFGQIYRSSHPEAVAKHFVQSAVAMNKPAVGDHGYSRTCAIKDGLQKRLYARELCRTAGQPALPVDRWSAVVASSPVCACDSVLPGQWLIMAQSAIAARAATTALRYSTHTCAGSIYKNCVGWQYCRVASPTQHPFQSNMGCDAKLASALSASSLRRPVRSSKPISQPAGPRQTL